MVVSGSPAPMHTGTLNPAPDVGAPNPYTTAEPGAEANTPLQDVCQQEVDYDNNDYCPRRIANSVFYLFYTFPAPPPRRTVRSVWLTA